MLARAALVASVALATPLAAQVQPLKWWWPQVQTEVPPVVPRAKPATVERVKIHGAALEGNLEGNAVDRDAIVFLPPSYAKRARIPDRSARVIQMKKGDT